MKDNKKRIIISLIFVVLGLLTPTLYFTRILEDKYAFPIMFSVIGIQFIYNGVFMFTTIKTGRYISLICGTLMLLFVIIIVIPHYL